MVLASTDLATDLLVGFSLLFVPASALTVITLGVGHWIRRRASASSGAFQHAVRWLHHGFALAPVLWILAAATLLARAYAEVGEWPQPEQFGGTPFCKPSNILAASLGAHHGAALALFTATWISLIAFPPLHFAAKSQLGARALVWCVGWLVTCIAGLLFAYDRALGVADWIL